MLRKNKFAAATIIGALAAAFTLVAPINQAQAVGYDCTVSNETNLRAAVANTACQTILITSTNGNTVPGSGILLTSDFDGNSKTIYVDASNYGFLVETDSIPAPLVGSPHSVTIQNATIIGLPSSKGLFNLNGDYGSGVPSTTTVTLSHLTLSTEGWYIMAVKNISKITFKDVAVTGGPALLNYDKADGNTLSFDFSGLTELKTNVAVVLGSSVKGKIDLTDAPDIVKALPSQIGDSGVPEVVPFDQFVAESGVVYTPLVSFDPANGQKLFAGTWNPVTKRVAVPADPSWDGYTFNKWYMPDNTVWDPTKQVTADLTLTAHWTGIQVVVNYDLNAPCCSEVKGSVPRNVQGKKIAFGSSLWVPDASGKSAVTAANYTFVGWSTKPDSTSRQAIVFASTPTSAPMLTNWDAVQQSKTSSHGRPTTAYSVTLYAVWQGVDVKVKFDPNAPAKKLTVAHMPANNPMDAKFCDTVKLPRMVPTAKGFTFVGWNTAADGTGTMYPAKGKVLIDTFVAPKDGKTGDNTFTLYAQWIVTPKNATVTYDANAPEGTTASGTMDPVSVDFGKTFTAAANGFTVKGWTFAGWSLSADGSDGIIKPGDVLTVTKDPALAFVTLFAQWTQNETPTPSEPSAPGSSAVAPTGGSVAGSAATTAGIVGMLMLVAAGGVFFVSRRRLAVH